MGEVNNLNFGHFGTATYDVDNSEWTFSRKLDRHELVPLGHWRTVVPASIHFPTPALSRPAPNVQQNVKALVRDCPDLVPAIEHLAELEIVSAAATSATFTYDATVGDLLSFGNITCRGHADHGSKHVVATAMGEVGNILRLEVSLTERYGWGDIDKLKGTMMEGPSMTSGECGYWNEEAAPIQQICFAQTEARSSFLAVRFNSRTVVFRPSYLHRRKATPSAYFDLPPSSVDARPILSISGKETGGASHAHVSFNPDYQRQFGIVDQRGQWSIWDIEFGHQNSKHTVHCSARGNIVSVEDESEDEDGNKKAYKEDGWARITWVGDATTIMMANRRHIRLFNFRSGSISLKCPPLLSTNSADWILDLKKHPSNKSQIFVLTSTRLYLLAVTCLSDDGENEHVDAGATVLVSWTHYRGTEDITLQLCLHTLGNDSLVLIHSRLNRLATIFQFATRGSGRSDRIYASDPVSINLQGLEEAAGSSYIRQMHLDQLQFKRAPKIHDPDLERLYAEEDVNFYRLNVMLSDLSIREILLYSCNGNRKRSSLQIEPVSRISFVRIRGCYGENLVDEDDMKDFIVPDGLTIARLPVLKNPYELPKTLERRTAPPAWYFYDYGSFYKTLVQPAPTVVDEGLLETADLAVVVNEVKRLLLDHSISAEPVLGTLLEYAGLSIAVSDIDEASIQMQETLLIGDGEGGPKLQRIAADYVLGSLATGTQDSSTILSLYDTILHNWVAPLPEDIPVQVRQHKERLARRVGAEIILATTRVRYQEEQPQPVLESQHFPSQDSGVAFPESSSQPIFSQPASSYLNTFNPPGTLNPPDTSSQLLPSIPETLPPSRFCSQPVSDPLSRLRKHLRIEKPLPERLPPSIAQVLTHWQPGANPNTYNWEEIEGAIQDSLAVDNESTQQKRDKARRKKERKDMRQRREDELFQHRTGSQPQMFRSSPGPTLERGVGMEMSSQVPVVQSQSQSQPFGGMVVQSQREPGKHGGRPEAKKKKKGKGRISGF